jgi:hypothetical protein
LSAENPAVTPEPPNCARSSLYFWLLGTYGNSNQLGLYMYHKVHDPDQLDWWHFKIMKIKHFDQRDLKFAKRNVAKAERLLVLEIAIVKHQRDAGLLPVDGNTVLVGLYESKRRAMEHLKRVMAAIA